MVRIVFEASWRLDAAGRCARSGDLLPCVVDNGARAGMRDGLVFLTVETAAVDWEKALPRTVLLKLVGVLDRNVEAGGALTVALLPAAEVLEFDRAGIDGVLERGGGALACVASISSRYRSPKTRNGRPYSSSHDTRIFVNSASTFGSSFAIRLRIFSSRSKRVGSRFSPF